MSTEIVGWAAALVLLVTISSQVWQQWRTRSTKGVSPWLFAGQVLASAGFTVYSVLVDNPVFVVTNVLILLSAIFGQFLFWRNQRKAPAIVESITRSAGIPVAPKPKRAAKRTTARSTARKQTPLPETGTTARKRNPHHDPTKREKAHGNQQEDK